MNEAITLPGRYSQMSPAERREARAEYAKLQEGRCYYCKGDLSSGPPPEIEAKSIDWRRFPPNFLRYPLHLHHHHKTDLTLGVVHARCNAVLWQYHGE